MGNLYFTGFAGGFIDDIIDIGLPFAIMSGELAGQVIIKNKNYTDIMKTRVKVKIKVNQKTD